DVITGTSMGALIGGCYAAANSSPLCNDRLRSRVGACRLALPSSSPAQADLPARAVTARAASRCLDIVAQCRGLLLHLSQAMLDDVADRYDADYLILLEDRNVTELARRHPLHNRADSFRLAACDDLG